MKRALILIAALVLAMPAAASATTYTVGPGQSIASGLSQAGDGDTVHIAAGTYSEQPLTVSHAVRIEGEAGTVVTNASADTAKPLFTVTSAGVTLTTMTIASTAGSPVDGQGANLSVADALILAAAGPGPALTFAGSGTNSLVRSSVAAIDPAADAVDVQSATAGDKALAVDSSILSGGSNAASLDVATSNSILTLTTGNVAVHAVHATIAGGTAAIATKVTSIGIGSPGTVTVSADRSILRGSVAGGVAVTSSDTSGGDVFVDGAHRNLHLRADAPDIDQGGPAVGGESDRDVDGQPRVAGAASDLGADEFVNRPPVARLASPAQVRTPGTTTFDASASTDPEAGAGGGISGYHFDFGDGTGADAPTPVVTHAYARPGTYAATVTVTDAQGLAGSASNPVQAQVLDGIAPRARIISPRSGKKLKRRNPIRFTGAATDDTAVAAVGLTLRRIGTKRPMTFKVRPQQGIWSYRVPRKRKLRAGRYELRAYAVDSAGNISSPARVRFTLK